MVAVLEAGGGGLAVNGFASVKEVFYSSGFALV